MKKEVDDTTIYLNAISWYNLEEDVFINFYQKAGDFPEKTTELLKERSDPHKVSLSSLVRVDGKYYRFKNRELSYIKGLRTAVSRREAILKIIQERPSVEIVDLDTMDIEELEFVKNIEL